MWKKMRKALILQKLWKLSKKSFQANKLWKVGHLTLWTPQLCRSCLAGFMHEESEIYRRRKFNGVAQKNLWLSISFPRDTIHKSLFFCKARTVSSFQIEFRNKWINGIHIINSAHTLTTTTRRKFSASPKKDKFSDGWANKAAKICWNLRKFTAHLHTSSDTMSTGTALNMLSMSTDYVSDGYLPSVSTEMSSSYANFSEMTTTTNATLLVLEDDLFQNGFVQFVFSVFYIIIFFLGMFGNLVVCFVVARQRTMQTVTK